MAGPIVDLVLLRGIFSDKPLTPGAMFVARVLDRDGPRGTLLLNGVRVPAQLPPDLAAGDALRVVVQEATAERVVLQVVPRDAPPPVVTPPAAYALALPGGVAARVLVDPEPEGEAGAAGRAAGAQRRVTLRYDSPALGRLDLVLDLDLDAGAVAGVVHATAGEPAERARAEAGVLRDALASATDRPASVAVRERGESLDVRA